VVTAVVTPVSGAHSTPSLIRNLVALVKKDPGVGPFTLAMKLDPHHRLGLGSGEVTALSKTDAVRRGASASRCDPTPLVTFTSGRQQ